MQSSVSVGLWRWFDRDRRIFNSKSDKVRNLHIKLCHRIISLEYVANDRFMNAASSKSCAFDICLLLFSFFSFNSLTWSSMCCIYATKSAMQIYSNKKDCTVEEIALTMARLFACTHSLACSWKCAWTLILLFYVQKKILRKKKTIRTLPRAMNTMKEPVVVLWMYTNI